MNPFILAPSTRKLVTWSFGSLMGIGILVILFFWWWWDFEPDLFDPVKTAQGRAEQQGEQVVTGYTTTATMIKLVETLLDKRGGYLSNDVSPPSVWMDNVPNWEFGVLLQIRDMARAMRIDFSRSQSQSKEDPDLNQAEAKFFLDSTRWLFPRAEGEYRDGMRLLESYLKRISNPKDTDAQFYARADNLRNWLAGVETRLGNLTLRLSQSVGMRQLNLALAGDPKALSATETPSDRDVKTPWMEIDDIFYEARGQTWALAHLLRAIERDFAPILEDKNAHVSLQQIIRDLEDAQQTIWSPMVLNGDGFGMVANHSLVLAAYIARANAALIDLRELLARG